MANRRMFSKSIVQSGRFISMPATAQLLYFHLGMHADDDGYVEALPLMRMINSNEQDLKVLQDNRLVRIFSNYVVIILDWKENNQIRPDRYTASIYLKEYPIEMATNGIPNGNQMATQYRLGKDRLGKDNTNVPPKGDTTSSWRSEFGEKYIQAYNKLFNKKCLMTPARVAKLKLRFNTFTSEQISMALINLSKSKWHQGDNDRGWVADPDFLIRNDEMIDKWINIKGGDSNGR